MNISGKKLKLLKEALELYSSNLENTINTCRKPKNYEQIIVRMQIKKNKVDDLIDQIDEKYKQWEMQRLSMGKSIS